MDFPFSMPFDGDVPYLFKDLFVIADILFVFLMNKDFSYFCKNQMHENDIFRSTTNVRIDDLR